MQRTSESRSTDARNYGFFTICLNFPRVSSFVATGAIRGLFLNRRDTEDAETSIESLPPRALWGSKENNHEWHESARMNETKKRRQENCRFALVCLV